MNRNSDILILLLFAGAACRTAPNRSGRVRRQPDPNVSPAFSQTSAPTSFTDVPDAWHAGARAPDRRFSSHDRSDGQGRSSRTNGCQSPKLPEPQTSSTPLPCRISATAEMLGPAPRRDSGTNATENWRRRADPKKTNVTRNFHEARLSPERDIFSRFCEETTFQAFSDLCALMEAGLHAARAANTPVAGTAQVVTE